MKLHLPVLLLNALMACLLSSHVGMAATISANTAYSTNQTLTEVTTIGADKLTLTFDQGVTVTQQAGGFNIGDYDLTLAGKGVLKINSASTVTVTKTLTIDGMTLDLSDSNAKLSNATYSNTSTYLVKGGGVMMVNNFVYDGNLGGCASSTGRVQLDNGKIQFTNADNNNWEYGLSILAGGGTVESMTAGKTVTFSNKSAGNLISSGASLRFTGAGNFSTAALSNVLQGGGGGYQGWLRFVDYWCRSDIWGWSRVKRRFVASDDFGKPWNK